MTLPASPTAAHSLGSGRKRAFDPGTCLNLPGLFLRKTLSQFGWIGGKKNWMQFVFASCFFVLLSFTPIIQASHGTPPAYDLKKGEPLIKVLDLLKTGSGIIDDVRAKFNNLLVDKPMVFQEMDSSGDLVSRTLNLKYLKDTAGTEKDNFILLIRDLLIIKAFQNDLYEHIERELTDIFKEEIYFSDTEKRSIKSILNGATNNEMKDIVNTLSLIANAGAATPDFKNDIFGKEAPSKLYYSIKANTLAGPGGGFKGIIVFAIDQTSGNCKYFLPKNHPMSGSANVVPYNSGNETVATLYQLETEFDNVQHLYDLVLQSFLQTGKTFYEKIQCFATQAKGEWSLPKNGPTDINFYWKFFPSSEFLDKQVPDIKDRAGWLSEVAARESFNSACIEKGNFSEVMKVNYYQSMKTTGTPSDVTKQENTKYIKCDQSLRNEDFSSRSFSFSTKSLSTDPEEPKETKASTRILTPDNVCYTELEIVFQKLKKESEKLDTSLVSTANLVFPPLIVPDLEKYLPKPLFLKSVLLEKYEDDINGLVESLNLKRQILKNFGFVKSLLGQVSFSDLEVHIHAVCNHFSNQFMEDLKKKYNQDQYLEFFSQTSEYYKKFFEKWEEAVKLPYGPLPTDVFSKDFDPNSFDAIETRLKDAYMEKQDAYKIKFDAFEAAYSPGSPNAPSAQFQDLSKLVDMSFLRSHFYNREDLLEKLKEQNVFRTELSIYTVTYHSEQKIEFTYAPPSTTTSSTSPPINSLIIEHKKDKDGKTVYSVNIKFSSGECEGVFPNPQLDLEELAKERFFEKHVFDRYDEPNKVITRLANDFNKENKFLQAILPLSYYGVDENDEIIELDYSVYFASTLAAQSQNLIANFMQDIDDSTNASEMFDLIDDGLFSSPILNAKVANDSNAIDSLHKFLCNFTNYFFYILKWKILKQEECTKKRTTLPTKMAPTESDYVNFDEAFVRFSGIWHFILDAIDKGKNPDLRIETVKKINRHFEGMLEILTKEKLPYYKAPKLHNVIHSNHYVFQGLLTDPPSIPPATSKTRDYFVQTYSSSTKSFSIYCRHVYKYLVKPAADPEIERKPEYSQNYYTGLRYSGNTLYPSSSVFFARLTEELSRQVSKTKGASLVSVSDSAYVMLMRHFIQVFDAAIVGKRDPEITTAPVRYGFENGFKLVITISIDNLVLSVLIVKDEVYVLANVHSTCPSNKSLSTPIGAIATGGIADSVYIRKVNPDFPVKSPLNHLCFANDEQFWCFDRNEKQVDFFATTSPKYTHASPQNNAIISKNFLTKNLDIPFPGTGEHVSVQFGWSDGMNAKKMSLSIDSHKYVIYPSFPYESQSKLVFHQATASSPFDCVTSSGYEYCSDVTILGTDAPGVRVIVVKKKDFVLPPRPTYPASLVVTHPVKKPEEFLVKAFVVCKKKIEFKVRKKVVTKEVLVPMFLNVRFYGWIEKSSSPRSSPRSYELYGYLDSTDRIGKLYSIKWLLDNYPLVALEVFKNDYSVTTQPNTQEIELFDQLFNSFPDKVEASLVLYLIFQPFYVDLYSDESCFAKSRESFIKNRPFLFVAPKNGFVDRPLAGYGHPYWEEKIFGGVDLDVTLESKLEKIEIDPPTGTPGPAIPHGYYSITTNYDFGTKKTDSSASAPVKREFHYHLAEFSTDDADLIIDRGELGNKFEITNPFSDPSAATLTSHRTNFDNQFTVLTGLTSSIFSTNMESAKIDKLAELISKLPDLALKSELEAGYQLKAKYEINKLAKTFDEFKAELIPLNNTIEAAKAEVKNLILAECIDQTKREDFNLFNAIGFFGNDLTEGLGECFIKNSKACFRSFFSPKNRTTSSLDDATIEKIHQYLALLYDMQSKHIMLKNFNAAFPAAKFTGTATKTFISVDDFQPLMPANRKEYIKDVFYKSGNETFYYYVLAAFETFKNMTVRNEQLLSVIYLLHSDAVSSDQNKILKLLMAAGKTAVIGPLLSILEPLTTKNALVGFVPPVFLYESNVIDYTKELIKLGVHVFSFRYERRIDLSDSEKSTISTIKEEDEALAKKDEIRLKRINDYLEYCIKSKNVFMTTAESVLCLMNRTIEFWTNMESYGGCLTLMADILKKLREHGRVAFDESHITFDPFKMLIFPIGSEKGTGLKKELVDIVTAFLTSQLYSAQRTEKCIFQMDYDTYNASSYGINVAIQRFFAYLKEKKSWFQLEYGLKLSEFFVPSKALENFLMDNNAYYSAKEIYNASPNYDTVNFREASPIVREFYSKVMGRCADKRVCFEFTMMVHKLLHSFVPSVLQKAFNQDYGFHPDMLVPLGQQQMEVPDDDDEDDEDTGDAAKESTTKVRQNENVYSIPYMAANKPSANSKFANPFDVIVKSFAQYAVHAELQDQNMQDVITYILSTSHTSESWDQCFSGYGTGSALPAAELNPTEITSQRKVKKYVNDALKDTRSMLNNATGISKEDKMDEGMFKRLDFISNFLRKSYFSHLKYDEYQIEGTAASFKHLLARVYGYSGTPGPILIYSGSSQNAGSVGPLGSAANNLFLTDEAYAPHPIVIFDSDPDPNDMPGVESFLDQIFLYLSSRPSATSPEGHSFDRFPYAIIDIAAVFKSFKNRRVADIFVDYLNAKRMDYEGVVYYDDVLNVPVFYSKEKATKVLAGMSPAQIRAEITGVDVNVDYSQKRYLVYYDQQHITGADFRFFYNSDAIVLLNNRVSFSYLLQGVMRMRQFFKGQQIRFTISAEMKETIMNYLEAKGIETTGVLTIQDILIFAFRYEQEQYIKNILQSFNQQINAAKRQEFFTNPGTAPESPKTKSILVSRQDFSSPLEDSKSTEMNFAMYIQNTLAQLGTPLPPEFVKIKERFSKAHMVNLELEIQFRKYIQSDSMKADFDYDDCLQIVKSRNPAKVLPDLLFEFPDPAKVESWFNDYKVGLEKSYDLLFETRTSMNVGSLNQSAEQENENRLQLEKTPQKVTAVEHKLRPIETNVKDIPMFSPRFPLDSNIKKPDLDHDQLFFYKLSDIIDEHRQVPEFTDISKNFSEFYLSNNLVFSFKSGDADGKKKLCLFDFCQKQLTDFVAMKQDDPNNPWRIVFITPWEASEFNNPKTANFAGGKSFQLCNIRQLIYQKYDGTSLTTFVNSPKYWDEDLWDNNIIIKAFVLTGSVPLLNEFFVNKVGYYLNDSEIKETHKKCRGKLKRLFHGPTNYRTKFLTIMSSSLSPCGANRFELLRQQLPVSELLKSQVDKLANLANSLRNIQLKEVEDLRKFADIISQYDPADFEEFENEYLQVVFEKMEEFIRISVHFIGHPVLNRVFCILQQFNTAICIKMDAVNIEKKVFYATYANYFKDNSPSAKDLIARNQERFLFPQRVYQLNNPSIAHLSSIYFSLIRPLTTEGFLSNLPGNYMDPTKNFQPVLQTFPDSQGLYISLLKASKQPEKKDGTSEGISDVVPTMESYCRLVCDVSLPQRDKDNYVFISSFKESLSKPGPSSAITGEMLLYLFTKFGNSFMDSLVDLHSPDNSHFLSKLTILPHTEWDQKSLSKFSKIFIEDANAHFSAKFEYAEIYNYITNLALLGYRDILTPQLLLRLLQTFSFDQEEIAKLANPAEYLSSFYFKGVAPLIRWKTVTKLFDSMKKTPPSSPLSPSSICFLASAMYFQGQVSLEELAKILQNSNISAPPSDPLKPFIPVSTVGEIKSDHRRLAGCLIAFLDCVQSQSNPAKIKAASEFMFKTPSLSSSVLYVFAKSQPQTVALLIAKGIEQHPSILSCFTFSDDLSILTHLPFSDPPNPKVWKAIGQAVKQTEINRSIQGSYEYRRSSLGFNANVYSAAKMVEKHDATPEITKIRKAAFMRNFFIILALCNFTLLLGTATIYTVMSFIKSRRSNIAGSASGIGGPNEAAIVSPESVDVEAMQPIEVK